MIKCETLYEETAILFSLENFREMLEINFHKKLHHGKVVKNNIFFVNPIFLPNKEVHNELHT